MKKFYSGDVVKLHGKEAIIQCADNYVAYLDIDNGEHAWNCKDLEIVQSNHSEFHVGDEIIILAPSPLQKAKYPYSWNPNEGPHGMDYWIGEKVTIKDIKSNGSIKVNENRWSWDECNLVHAHELDTFCLY